MNCPTGMASSADAATAVASLAEKGMIHGKPVLSCWLGQATARKGREILQAAGVAPAVARLCRVAFARSDNGPPDAVVAFGLRARLLRNV